MALLAAFADFRFVGVGGLGGGYYASEVFFGPDGGFLDVRGA